MRGGRSSSIASRPKTSPRRWRRSTSTVCPRFPRRWCAGCRSSSGSSGGA